MAGCYEHDNKLSDCIKGSWLAQQLTAFMKEPHPAKQENSVVHRARTVKGHTYSELLLFTNEIISKCIRRCNKLGELPYLLIVSFLM
jgi:hypothetical protein